MGMYSTTHQNNARHESPNAIPKHHHIGIRWRVPDHLLLISHNVFLRQLIIVVPLDPLG